MSHLSGTERIHYLNHIYEIVLGSSNVKRWTTLKRRLDMSTESSFVEYLLDAGEMQCLETGVLGMEEDESNMRNNNQRWSSVVDPVTNATVMIAADGELASTCHEETGTNLVTSNFDMCRILAPSVPPSDAIEHVDLNDSNEVDVESQVFTTPPKSVEETIIAAGIPLYAKADAAASRQTVISESESSHQTMPTDLSQVTVPAKVAAAPGCSLPPPTTTESVLAGASTPPLAPYMLLSSTTTTEQPRLPVPPDVLSSDGNWCNLCQKKMHSKSYLKTHVNTVHLGQKPHQCDHCLQKFTRISTFRDHVRAVHMGVKPHVCQVCRQSFAKASNLRAHVESVHLNRRNYECTVCGHTFSSNRKRLVHEKKHTPIE